jgi:hypothetical protein
MSTQHRCVSQQAECVSHALPVCRMLLKVRLQFWISKGKAYVCKLHAETTWMGLEFLMVPDEFT